jgi:hypothetical protein
MKITNRMKPCTCGCRGSDSQHRASFDRVVADVVAESGITDTALRRGHAYAKTGTARLPWGVVRVVWCPDQPNAQTGEWYINQNAT